MVYGALSLTTPHLFFARLTVGFATALGRGAALGLALRLTLGLALACTLLAAARGRPLRRRRLVSGATTLLLGLRRPQHGPATVREATAAGKHLVYVLRIAFL